MLFVLAVNATELKTYYAAANGKSGASLKTALYGIIGNPDVKSYGALWTYYYDTDRASDNSVIDRYCNTKRYFGNSASENAVSGMNKEHGIAQSWWGGGTSTKDKIGCDIMHVMPSDTEANSRKSNYGMGVVSNQTWTNGSIKVGKGKAGSNGTIQLWEPADEWKGDFARIYFYIVTCYEDKNLTSTEGSNSMEANTYPKLQSWAVELYMKWSKEDPVSEIERQRNNAVEKVQGNRNPYVDMPGLEQYVWGSLKNTPVNITDYVDPSGGDTPSLETPEISFATPSVTLAVGDLYEQIVNTNSNGTVTYSSSDNQVATVDEDGQVHALATGKAVITASVCETSIYAAASASYTVFVTANGDDPVPAPTGNSYVKITTEPDDWTGTYLIVYETGKLAFNSILSTLDAAGNCIEVDIENGEIALSDQTEKAEFQVTHSGAGYAFLGRNGLYMGTLTTGNKLTTSSDPIVNYLSVGSDGIDVKSDYNTYLRYNTAGTRFRYYSAGSQQPIQLYRRTEADNLDEIKNEKLKVKNDNVYDLAGRQIVKSSNGKLKDGLYIVDGKKIVKR